MQFVVSDTTSEIPKLIGTIGADVRARLRGGLRSEPGANHQVGKFPTSDTRGRRQPDVPRQCVFAGSVNPTPRGIKAVPSRNSFSCLQY